MSQLTRPATSATSSINLTALINGRPVGGFQILITVLCGLIVFAEGYDAPAIAYAAPSIGAAWKIGKGSMGPVFGAGLTGIMIGSLFISPLADKFGRRKVILISTLAFALMTLVTAFAQTPTSLSILRFLTGIGIGGAMPNAIALTSEYSSALRRNLLIMLMFCGFSLGSAIGGFVAVGLIPHYGWQAVFYFGGLMPIVLLPFLFFLLPESICFLAARDSADPMIGKLLNRVAPGTPAHSRVVLDEIKTSRGSVVELVSNGRIQITVLLWIIFFMSLLDLNLIVSWLPSTLAASGTPMGHAVLAGSIFQLGGIVGAVLLGVTSNRLGAGWVLSAAYAVAAISIGLIAETHSASAATMLAVAGAGFGVVGGQIAANALPAAFYPTTIRSTGVGWALGIGRIGSIVGPVVGGILLNMDMPPKQLFLLSVVPILVAALAAAVLQVLLKHRTDALVLAHGKL
jgi:AAHS family 4-hydroxybenzoate transporter-like MFS transporter